MIDKYVCIATVNKKRNKLTFAPYDIFYDI